MKNLAHSESALLLIIDHHKFTCQFYIHTCRLFVDHLDCSQPKSPSTAKLLQFNLQTCPRVNKGRGALNSVKGILCIQAHYCSYTSGRLGMRLYYTHKVILWCIYIGLSQQGKNQRLNTLCIIL